MCFCIDSIAHTNTGGGYVYMFLMFSLSSGIYGNNLVLPRKVDFVSNIKRFFGFFFLHHHNLTLGLGIKSLDLNVLLRLRHRAQLNKTSSEVMLTVTRLLRPCVLCCRREEVQVSPVSLRSQVQG